MIFGTINLFIHVDKIPASTISKCTEIFHATYFTLHTGCNKQLSHLNSKIIKITNLINKFKRNNTIIGKYWQMQYLQYIVKLSTVSSFQSQTTKLLFFNQNKHATRCSSDN